MTTFILCVVAFIAGIVAAEIPAVQRAVARIRAQLRITPHD